MAHGIEGSSKRRPIALLSSSMLGGGAERVMAILANELAKREVPVDLLLVHAVGEYLDTLSPAVNIVELPSARIVTSTLPVARYLRKIRPRCLLSTLTSVNLIALLAHTLARSDARLVLREANTPSVVGRNALRPKDRLIPILAKRAYPHADTIVAVSRGVAEDMLEHWGVPGDKIAVIYNPLIGPELKALAAEPAMHPWLSESEHPIVLAVGRLTRQKNYPLLLAAFANLIKEGPARLIILGEGEERPELELLVQQLGLGESVAMPGFESNPFAYMARASALALSSSWEGLPGVLIQALACGCPVVSTDCPSGPREILDEGRIGRLVPMDDPEALCAGMRDAIAGRLHAAGPDWLSRFSPDRVVQQYLRVMGVDGEKGTAIQAEDNQESKAPNE